MRFVIDLDSLELIESATDRRRVTQVEGKRGDDSPFEVVFVRSGVAEELAASTVLTFGAKQEGKYDAAAVVLENGFTLSGSGTTAVYGANPSFNTAGLNALFLIDADDTNDPTYIDLMAEFTWQIGAGAPTSTKTFRFRVHNDVVRDDEVSPTPAYSPIGSTAAVNVATASVTINPTGADNSVTYTANAAGAEGNDITITYATPAESVETITALAGTAITVTPGTKARMTISGSLTSDGSTPVVFPVLFYDRTTFYDWKDEPSIGGAADYFISGESGDWTIGTSSVAVLFTSSDAVVTPDLVTTWTPFGSATGTPVITAGISSASQVVASVNDSGPAAALVTATPTGTVTGAVAAVAATNLAGGVTATATPPYIRVAGGFLYVQEAGVWKKTALSAL